MRSIVISLNLTQPELLDLLGRVLPQNVFGTLQVVEIKPCTVGNHRVWRVTLETDFPDTLLNWLKTLCYQNPA